MLYFLNGAIAFGFFVASLFFLRFWRRTGDGLFFAFALAFALLALAQTVISALNIYFENSSAAYLLRLAAFALIIVAIARKNRKAA